MQPIDDQVTSADMMRVAQEHFPGDFIDVFQNRFGYVCLILERETMIELGGFSLPFGSPFMALENVNWFTLQYKIDKERTLPIPD